MWDNSDYPKDNPYYSAYNKKVIGKLKDEAEVVPVVEFVGLRSKMYSYVKENGKGGMTAKGVKKYVIKNKLTHDHFKGVIREKEQPRHNMNTMRSVKHQVGTYEMRKLTLSCFDDKRHLLNDGVTSYAYGHKNISANCEDPELVRIDPVVEERGPKEVGPIEEFREHHTIEKIKVFSEPGIHRLPRAKRVTTMTFAEDDEVEVKLEKHWTPKLELVKKRKRKIPEGKCFEVFSEPEIQRVPRARRVKTMTFAEDEVEAKLEKRRAPKLELVKKRKSKVSKGKCIEVFDKSEIRKVPKAMRATMVTNECTVEPDRSWLRDNSR